MGSCKSIHKKSQILEIGLDTNILLITTYAQKHLAHAFKYSLDEQYPIRKHMDNFNNDEQSYQPVRIYKTIRTDEKRNLELSVSISRCIVVYNTEPYYDYFLENKYHGFNIIIFLYDSSNISSEDFLMTMIHMKKHIDVYNPEKIVALNFDQNGIPADQKITLPQWISIIITKIPYNKSNFADKLIDRILNYDIITSDFSMTSDMPSVLSESTIKTLT